MVLCRKYCLRNNVLIFFCYIIIIFIGNCKISALTAEWLILFVFLASVDLECQFIWSVLSLMSRVFQWTLMGVRKSPHPSGGMGNLLRGIFYWVVEICFGVILTFPTIFKVKKNHSVNIKHWLKSKLAWPVCTKSMKLK